MIHHDAEAKRKTVTNCHHGHGSLLCIERFADCKRATVGIKFVHEDVLEPGTCIGAHRHEGDEEIYLVLEGTGEMLIDGGVQVIGSGDLCLTRHGHIHGLANTGAVPLRLLVVCVGTGEA